MKTSINKTLPETVPGLEIFIKEAEKEANKFIKLAKAATEKLTIKKDSEKRESMGLN